MMMAGKATMNKFPMLCATMAGHIELNLRRRIPNKHPDPENVSTPMTMKKISGGVDAQENMSVHNKLMWETPNKRFAIRSVKVRRFVKSILSLPRFEPKKSSRASGMKARKNNSSEYTVKVPITRYMTTIVNHKLFPSIAWTRVKIGSNKCIGHKLEAM